MTTFQKVRAITAFKGWSQKGLAMELGVSPSLLCRIVRGNRKPQSKLLERLDGLCPHFTSAQTRPIGG